MPYADMKKKRARSRAYAEANRDSINAYHAEWERRNPDKVRAYHKKRVAQKAAYDKEYNKANAEAIQERRKLWEAKGDNARHLSARRLELRAKVFDHYGFACECCGEAHWELLTIDHVNGDGKEHRRSIGGSANLYKWLIDNDFPGGFRTLCMNCNFARGLFGYCPHETENR